MSKPKIILISSARSIGGGEVYLKSVIPSLKGNFDVKVLAPRTVRKYIEDSSVTSSFFPFPEILEKYIKRNYRLKKFYYSFYNKFLFRKYNKAIINVQWFDGAFLESIKIHPLILTLHTAFDLPREHDNYIAQVLNSTDGIICVSEYARKNLLKRGVNKSLCHLIPNGLDIDASFSYDKDPTQGTITWIGRVEDKAKNPLLFLKIAREAQKNKMALKFKMVGDGSYLPFLKNYAKEHELRNISFTGFVIPKTIPKDILSESSILCLTSTSESLPLVAIEAMASGTPIVSTPVGGMPELIPSKKYGILIDDSSPEEFLDAISKLIKNPTNYQSVRKAAYDLYLNKYTEKCMTDNTTSFFLNILKGSTLKLNVGIEGSVFFGNSTGVGQYSKRLSGTAASYNKNVQFEVVRHWIPFRNFQTPTPDFPALKYRLVKWFPPMVYFQVFKRLGTFVPYDFIALKKNDAFIFYNFIAFPLRKSTVSIPAIHDLSFIQFPDLFSPKNLTYYNKFVPKSIERASHIITVSENSKKEIAEYYKVPADKITVVTPSIDHAVYNPRPSQQIAMVKSKYNIDKPYFLSVCTLEPRKNLIGVLNAFSQLPEDIKKKYALVLAGGKGWLDGELLEKYENLSRKYTIIRTGYVLDEDLPALYSGAYLFLYPSFYEGFGMPILEAMACGVPVICSDNSSIPEVAEGASIMLKAEDTDGLTESIIKLLNDKKLYKHIKHNGLERAKEFSWEKSSQVLVELVRRLVITDD